MSKFALRATGAAAIAAATMIAASAQAAGFGPGSALDSAADRVSATENVQYMYRGHRHCWYPGGWHGPGWYWCGYAHRRGMGWGGPRGWHGWHEGRAYRHSYTTGSGNVLHRTDRNAINKAIQRGSTTDQGAAPPVQ